MDLEEFDKRLHEEYNNPHPSRILKEAILAFLENNSSVEEYDIIFIKKLTKIMSNMFEQDQRSLNGHLERVIQYHLEGIEKIKSDETQNAHLLTNSAVMKCHFHRHISSIAKRMVEREKNLETKLIWATDWYSNGKEAGEIMSSVDHIEAAQGYINAEEGAYNAQKIAIQLKDKEAEKFFSEEKNNMLEQAIKYSEGTDEVLCAIAHYRAGHDAANQFQKKPDIKTARDVRLHTEYFLEVYRRKPAELMAFNFFSVDTVKFLTLKLASAKKFLKTERTESVYRKGRKHYNPRKKFSQ